VISVLIPSRTDAYLARALESLFWYGGFQGTGRRIIVGDNGLAERDPHPAIVYVDVPRPFNFARAINLCAAAADPTHDLLILNDDAHPLDFYFPVAIECALKWGREEGYGLLSPRIEGGVGNDDQRMKTPIGTIKQTFRSICFMAAAIPRHVWNEIGPLDERFDGYGCDDLDYSRRVVEAGYKLGVAGWTAVEHGFHDRIQSGTFLKVYGQQTYAEMGQRALKIFFDKWGEGPQLGEYECERTGE